VFGDYLFYLDDVRKAQDKCYLTTQPRTNAWLSLTVEPVEKVFFW
jgi:hypothetical protein